MDDLTRIFGENKLGECDCFECNIPDPDPATDYSMPGDVKFGSPAFYAQLSALADDRLDFTVSDPDDDGDWLSDADEIEFDRPGEDEELWWAAETREQACAAELMLAEAQVKADYEQSNNYMAVLDEGDSLRWYRADVTEF